MNEVNKKYFEIVDRLLKVIEKETEQIKRIGEEFHNLDKKLQDEIGDK